MTDFLETLALAVVTVSGTAYLVGGVHDTRPVAVGEVRRLAEAMATGVHMGHGAMAETAGAGHGAHLWAVEAAVFFTEEEGSVEMEVALAAVLWEAREVSRVACLEEV